MAYQSVHFRLHCWQRRLPRDCLIVGEIFMQYMQCVENIHVYIPMILLVIREMVNVTVVINPKEVTGFHGAINTKNRPLCTTADSCCHTAAHLGRLLKDILGIIGRFRQLLFLPQSCNSYTHSQEKNDHSQPSYYRCNRPDYTLQSSWYPEVKWPRPLYTPSGQNSPQEISN